MNNITNNTHFRNNNVDEQTINNIIKIIPDFYDLRKDRLLYVILIIRDHLSDDIDRRTLLNTVIASTLYCCKTVYSYFDINDEAKQLASIFYDPEDITENL